MLNCCSEAFGTIPYLSLGNGFRRGSQSVWLRSKCLFGPDTATFLCGPRYFYHLGPSRALEKPLCVLRPHGALIPASWGAPELLLGPAPWIAPVAPAGQIPPPTLPLGTGGYSPLWTHELGLQPQLFLCGASTQKPD